MNKFFALLALCATAALAGCGGGGAYVAVIEDPQVPVLQPIYEHLRYPTISVLEYVSSSARVNLRTRP